MRQKVGSWLLCSTTTPRQEAFAGIRAQTAERSLRSVLMASCATPDGHGDSSATSTQGRSSAAGLLSSLPEGAGPVTTAMMLRNVVAVARREREAM